MRLVCLTALLLAPCFANAQTCAGSATLSWTAPTTRTDGTALTDLAGFSLHHGDSPGLYTESVEVDDPAATSYVIENLCPGTHYFAATAFDAAGLDSEFSNEASKVIEGVPELVVDPDNLTAYAIVLSRDRLALIPVGTVGMDVPCDPSQDINGRNVVPRESVTWYGNVRPEVVVAECSVVF